MTDTPKTPVVLAAVAERAEALEAMMADGSITESDLDSGWP